MVLGEYADVKTLDVRTIKIGNFPPRYKARVHCFMYSENKIEDQSYIFQLPLIFKPKYSRDFKPGFDQAFQEEQKLKDIDFDIDLKIHGAITDESQL